MQVKTIINPSATVVRVTEVEVGAIYKRLDTPSYGEPRILFGVVTDILSDGDTAAVVAVEFSPAGYSTGYETRVRTFAGDQDVTIYPATDVEFNAHVEAAIEGQARVIETAARDLATKTAVLDMLTQAADKGTVLVSTVTLAVEA